MGGLERERERERGGVFVNMHFLLLSPEPYFTSLLACTCISVCRCSKPGFRGISIFLVLNFRNLSFYNNFFLSKNSKDQRSERLL